MTRPPPAAAGTAIHGWLAGREDEMVSLIGTLVNTDSGSGDASGIRAVADHLRSFLEANASTSPTRRARRRR